MNLSEMITGAEAALNRALTADEIALVGRMHSAGKDISDVLTMLDKEVEQADEEGGRTIRYEARGSVVVPIK